MPPLNEEFRNGSVRDECLPFTAQVQSPGMSFFVGIRLEKSHLQLQWYNGEKEPKPITSHHSGLWMSPYSDKPEANKALPRHVRGEMVKHIETEGKRFWKTKFGSDKHQ